MDTTNRTSIQIGNTNIHYFPRTIIGKGISSPSVVYEGFYGVPAIKAAIKEMDKSDENSYHREMTVFINIKADPQKPCTNVVQLHGWCETADNFYLAMEKADHNLRGFLTKYPNLERSFKLKIIQDVVKGVDFLHDKDILHRDIKPENVLLFGDDKNALAKLGDFRVSRKMSNATSTRSRGRGTEEWVSPEALIAKHKNVLLETTKYLDIFSLGMLSFFTLSNGQHPFHYKTVHGFDQKSNIKDKDIPPMKLNETPKCYSTTHVLGWMMQKEPVDNRPSISQVSSHPMFWKPLECLDFICHIATSLNDKKKEECRIIREDIDGRYRLLYRKLFGGHFSWIPLVDARLFVRIDGGKSKYFENSVMSLVEFIRNKKDHFKDRLSDLRRDRFEDQNGGYSEEKYVQYYLALFPDLVIFLFCEFLGQTAPYFAHIKEKFYKDYDSTVNVTFVRDLITN